MGYTARHLHQRIVEHKNSAIGKHLVEAHGQLGNPKESQFRILRKCQTKFECLIYEMLFIKEINPSLNTQADSIRAKLFVWTNILTLYISFLMMHRLSSIYTL